jgi:hypothetical protein
MSFVAGDSSFGSKTTRGELMTTGKKAASDAARILRDSKSTRKEKEVAASDLAQRRGASSRKGKGK